MAGAQDDNEKTEEPSQRRLEQAKQKGQVPFSRELVTFVLFLAAAPMVVSIWPTLFPGYIGRLSAFLTFDKIPVLNGGLTADTAQDAVLLFLLIFLPFGFALMIAGLIAGSSQHPLILSAEQLKPKAERISPLSGFKRLFSMKSLVEFIKGILKLIVVAVIGYIAIAPDTKPLVNMAEMPFSASFGVTGDIATRFLIGICIFTAVIGILDYLYQRYELLKSLRMSMQEIKDEYKETEGNPEIKAKLRQIRAERAQQRMMQNVPSADVVITNPTHYAVALKYDMEKDPAPRVVAKGADHAAFRIRDLAEKHDVPIVRNPPLARALYDSAEVEQTVPEDMYRAVAEVIRYVYGLKGKL